MQVLRKTEYCTFKGDGHLTDDIAFFVYNRHIRSGRMNLLWQNR